MAPVVKQGTDYVLDIITPSIRRQLGKGISGLSCPFWSQSYKLGSLAMTMPDIANYNYWFDTLWGNLDFAVVLDKLIPSVEAEQPSVEELCQDYLNIVNTLEIVKQILIAEDEEGFTIWTLIEAEPFDDSQRMPIYQAQINIMRQMEEGIPIDFRILNISEYKQIEDIIPSNAEIYWQR